MCNALQKDATCKEELAMLPPHAARVEHLLAQLWQLPRRRHALVDQDLGVLYCHTTWDLEVDHRR